MVGSSRRGSVFLIHLLGLYSAPARFGKSVIIHRTGSQRWSAGASEYCASYRADFSVIESWIFVAYSSYTASCDQFDGKIIVRAMCDILRARGGCGAKFSDSIENS